MNICGLSQKRFCLWYSRTVGLSAPSRPYLRFPVPLLWKCRCRLVYWTCPELYLQMMMNSRQWNHLPLCSLYFISSSPPLKLGVSPEGSVSSPASRPAVPAGCECPRHLTCSSKNSTLLHRTAGRCFSCMQNWALAGAKMMFPCREWCFLNSLHPCFLLSLFIRKEKENNSEILYLKCAVLSPH